MVLCPPLNTAIDIYWVTQVLTTVIVGLSLLIMMTVALRAVLPKDTDETVAMAKLCAAYYTYADTTHRTLAALETHCVRDIPARPPIH
jgi:hypothetical protein